ncbi:MAG: sigma-70 family RNA polymerase sigma factor [Bacteroidota bacterium]
MNTQQPHPDHQQVIELGFRQGQSAPITRIYREVGPGLVKKLRSSGATENEARDIFQEAMIVLMQKATDPAFVLTAPVGAYLSEVCRRLWLSALRKGNSRKEVSLDALDASMATDQSIHLIDRDLDTRCFRLLDSCYQQLSETCRELLMRLKKGGTAAEITEQMNMNSRHTFDRRKHACIKRWGVLIQAADPTGYCKSQLL